jgi:small subunit ribosomal protein S6
MAEKRTGSCRDIPGRTREYETIFILKPDVTNDAIGQANAKIRHVIEAAGGRMLKVENWGRRKLAYEVKKQLKGIYVFFNYTGGAGLVEEVERNLHLTDTVIRYYSIKAAENVDPATKTSTVHPFLAPTKKPLRPARPAHGRSATRKRKARSISKKQFSARSTNLSGEGARPWHDRKKKTQISIRKAGARSRARGAGPVSSVPTRI